MLPKAAIKVFRGLSNNYWRKTLSSLSDKDLNNGLPVI
jgi:hypothetical protein